jgi:hypothetical protein
MERPAGKAGERRKMPLYMDIHRNLEGLTADAVADAHQKDLEIQDEYGASTTGTGTTRKRAKSSVYAKRLAKKQRRPFIGRLTASWQTR